MSEKLLARNKYQGMKIVQYESIPVVKDMSCPECHQSEVDGTPPNVYATPIGWCETPSGFMGVFECPKCFAKFRCHIDSTGRCYAEEFYDDFALLHYLYYRRQEV